MSYIFDGILILVVLAFTIGGIRKGLVRSAAEFLGALASALLAAWLGGVLSTVIFDNFFRQGLYDRILKATQGKAGGEAVTALFEGLPDVVVRLLEAGGITQSSVTHAAGGASKDLAANITAALSPIFIGVIKVFAVIILFILFMLIIKALASLVSGIFKLPVLAQINGVLGGIFGFFLSAIVIWVIVAVLGFVSPLLDSTAKKTVDTAVADSYVAKTMVDLNPFAWIFE